MLLSRTLPHDDWPRLSQVPEGLVPAVELVITIGVLLDVELFSVTETLPVGASSQFWAHELEASAPPLTTNWSVPWGHWLEHLNELHAGLVT